MIKYDKAGMKYPNNFWAESDLFLHMREQCSSKRHSLAPPGETPTSSPSASSPASLTLVKAPHLQYLRVNLLLESDLAGRPEVGGEHLEAGEILETFVHH